MAVLSSLSSMTSTDDKNGKYDSIGNQSNVKEMDLFCVASLSIFYKDSSDSTNRQVNAVVCLIGKACTADVTGCLFAGPRV